MRVVIAIVVWVALVGCSSAGQNAERPLASDIGATAPTAMQAQALPTQEVESSSFGDEDSLKESFEYMLRLLTEADWETYYDELLTPAQQATCSLGEWVAYQNQFLLQVRMLGFSGPFDVERFQVDITGPIGMTMYTATVGGERVGTRTSANPNVWIWADGSWRDASDDKNDPCLNEVDAAWVDGGWASAPTRSGIPAISDGRRILLIAGMCSSTERLESPDHWMNTVKRWLTDEFGYVDAPVGDSRDQLIEVSYSPEAWDAPYNAEDTLRGITDAVTNLLQIYGVAYPDATFDIIGHSLGGVVALDAVARSPFIRSRTNSVTTVDSPIRGVGDPEAFLGSVISESKCGGDLSAVAARQYRVWADLHPDGAVITRIENDNWDDLLVINAANSEDRIVSAAAATFPDKGVREIWNAGGSGLTGAHSAILADLSLRSQLVISNALRGRPN